MVQIAIRVPLGAFSFGEQQFSLEANRFGRWAAVLMDSRAISRKDMGCQNIR